MEQTAIFGPMFATILLTFAVFLSSANVDPQDLTAPGALAALSPPAVSNPADNFRNLFEIPVLFYALALYLYLTGQVDAGYVIAAWIFFAFRVLHSAVHCTINVVMLRFYLYLVSTLAVWYMAGRAALSLLGS